ncbi:hypothetical protein QU38_01375, partial [Staphylococcus aureus]
REIAAAEIGGDEMRAGLGSGIAAAGLTHAGPFAGDEAAQLVVARDQRGQRGTVIGFAGVTDDDRAEYCLVDPAEPGGGGGQYIVGEQRAGIGGEIACSERGSDEPRAGIGACIGARRLRDCRAFARDEAA